MRKKELLNKLNILTDFEKNIVSLTDKQSKFSFKNLKKQTILRKFSDIKRIHRKHIRILDEIKNRIKREKSYVY